MSMKEFSFFNPTRIHFGAGKLNTLGSLAASYADTCLLVTTSAQEAALRPLYERVIKLLGDQGLTVFHFDEVVPNPTVQSIEKAIGLVKEKGIQLIIACGGGSSMDTAKAVALFHGPDRIDWEEAYQAFTSPFAQYPPVSDPVLPVIAVPTTAGTGSELTQAMIISDLTTTEKVCIFHDKVFPKEAIIDPELTLSMPPRLTAMTGFDAFSHAFESYVRDEASVYTQLIGLQAIKNILQALPALMKQPGDLALRTLMSQAEMFAGISLSNAAATVPHPLSEVIGGIAPRIPHGQALASLYPSFVRFQIQKTPEKCAQIARLFDKGLHGQDDAAAANALPGLVENFLKSIGLNQTLTELGVNDQEKEQMLSHFLLCVLPFGSKEELTQIMLGAF